MRIMIELCSGGREPEDEKLLKDWCELNAKAVWERGMFQASPDIPPEPVKRGTPSGLSFGAVLNTVFSQLKLAKSFSFFQKGTREAPFLC